uniref:Odorant receptor n=1 Tax=Mythimna separata TaxID=271217 RepID=A0A7H1DHC2_MYTSE|nr:olfactory receptor 63b [Mythimna separata]
MAAMIKKIKSFYNKENTNYSTGYVDPFEFHQTFYQMLVNFKVADLKNKNPPSYFNQNMILFIVALMATIICFCSFHHGLETSDLSLITEAGTYTIVLSYKLIILSCTRRNLPQYHNLLKAIKKDFEYICSEGEKYRAQYFEEQLLTWKICIVMCTFNAGIGIAMNIFAYLSLFYFLATHDANTKESRPLLFPFWLPNVDLSKSPIYEIAFMFANITALLYAYNYLFMLQTQILWIRQIISKVDIVIWSLEDLLVDIYPTTNKEESEYYSRLIENRMRDIIIHHQSMYSLLQDYAIVYKKLLIFEQIICGPVVCLTAYCIAEKIDKGEFQAILLLLCIATIVMYFTPSLLCTYLSIKVKSVCDACWSIPFWNAGPVIRPYMVLMMQRSLRPLPIQSPGFKDISVETFSQKLTSAYSLFNMLRA